MDSMKNVLFYIVGEENEVKSPNGRSNNTNCQFKLHLIAYSNEEAKIRLKIFGLQS